MGIKVLAPAKINLGLEILDKRSDGYHNVDMIMQSVSLYDVLDVSVTDSLVIDIKSNVDFGCSLENNIMYRVANCFFEFTNINNPGILIEIQKNIPSFAGLAGGSSDGAAVVLALDKLFDTRLSKNEFMEICAKVGSDVPFCMVGGTARARGRGTLLSPINSHFEYHLVIVKPDINVSTESAYSKADNIILKNIDSISKIEDAFHQRRLLDVCNNLFNRFEDVLDVPEIFSLKDRMKKLGAMGALMTGSGSAVFGIFEDYESAAKCHEIMRGNFKNSFLCKPIFHGAVIVN